MTARVKADDLEARDLLDLPAGGGVARFAGERVLLLDATALGLLRKELVTTFGATAARGVLTRLGYAHGWRTAETLREAFTWDDPREWRRAGGHLHALMGLVVAEAAPDEPEGPFLDAVWRDSYEAEQHVLHLGRAEAPACATLVGFATGYLSRAHGREVLVVETRCAAQGHATCRVVGKPVEAWGAEADAHRRFYEKGCLDADLARVAAELERVEGRVRARRRRLQALDEDAGPAAGAPDGDEVAGVVARSPAMREVVALVRRAARVESTVLITGESGVGKERLARLVHDESPRAGGPFVAVNGGALAEGLVEGELFGHARGAFTGATADRPGLFEAAGGGTLFLDEVGDLAPGTQVKLLRALQEREVRRLGETRARPVDVRVVAATHRDLDALVAAGRFRQDLLYRLRVVEVRVPPLRDRRDDILPLARALLVTLAPRMRSRARGFTPAAADALLRHAWPGNARELHNAVERALLCAAGERVDLADLPEDVRRAPGAPAREAPPGAPGDADRTLEEVERAHVLATLARHGGARAATAAALGIGTATLYRRLRRWRYAGGGGETAM